MHLTRLQERKVDGEREEEEEEGGRRREEEEEKVSAEICGFEHTRSKITPKRRQKIKGPARSVSFNIASSVFCMGFNTERVYESEITNIIKEVRTSGSNLLFNQL